MDAVDRKLALGRAPGLSAAQLRAALVSIGGVDRLADPAALEALVGRPPAQLTALGLSHSASLALALPAVDRIAADRAWVERAQVQLVDALSPSYPPLLARIADAPALLYVRGDPRELSAPQLAMVGSRSPTDAGRRTAQAFAAYLAQAGLTITSGLALGIDAASHAGALGAEGRTLAVLAHGLDRIYPQEHAGLAERIAAQGALVSEMPPGTPPLKRCFLRRNRLISGLSLGTLVIEAGRYSGALSTAHAAAEQGREVFAVPGSIHNPLAQGCHALIRGGAMLVESARDVLQELHIPLKNQMIDDDPGGSRASVPEDRMGAGFRSATLDKEYKILLDALGFEPVEIDRLVERSGLSSPAVASMLLILELEGLVRLQSDGRYLRMADA